jgi:predicted Fe-Mo cluster-binding NifX family protein
MKVAVTSQGKEPTNEVDPRFGRAAYFLIFDIETMTFGAFENDRDSVEEQAGISAARAVTGAGVQSVLTGNCGPKAANILHDAGVRLYTGVTGTVSEAIELCQDGRLTEAKGPNVSSHFGEQDKSKAWTSNGTDT